ncbi:Bifunctional inhibitor/plant lipid transfer protein/seed storage helical domain-containing protein [Cynara cardunculus var. scolymus]|uniref:Bifunctional inhibitor/plant lipid transfer protein/seed storage helical domain-containing protein n=1 Tax=Cynara cardunculus var. scolymus TaxID=59895 RepID=A0A103YMU4_CYNCS|nr:Bifunctional inhibitor/plant lipid transfer protein/seed storage helical domain-containing protein [Cynara cardunculus var. scolymus]
MKVASGILLAVVLLFAVEMQVAKTATCDLKLILGACNESLTEGAVPSEECCSILKDQQPCICGYKENFGWFGTAKAFGFCHLPIPPCA